MPIAASRDSSCRCRVKCRKLRRSSTRRRNDNPAMKKRCTAGACSGLFYMRVVAPGTFVELVAHGAKAWFRTCCAFYCKHACRGLATRVQPNSDSFACVVNGSICDVLSKSTIRASDCEQRRYGWPIGDRMHVLRTQMESFHNGHCRPARCARTVSSDTDGEQHSQSRFELHVFHGPGGGWIPPRRIAAKTIPQRTMQPKRAHTSNKCHR